MQINVARKRVEKRFKLQQLSRIDFKYLKRIVSDIKRSIGRGLEKKENVKTIKKEKTLYHVKSDFTKT